MSDERNLTETTVNKNNPSMAERGRKGGKDRAEKLGTDNPNN